MTAWLWRFERNDGAEVGASAVFPAQADAESWLGENWRELLAQGIDRVVLLNEEREVYGPMSLHAE
jgi:hypothetical protein